MVRRLYDWTLRLADTPHALWALAAISFIESSVFPIPPDVLLIPMVLARPDRAWLIAGVCTVASVLGGLAGYGIGWGLYDAVGRPILEFYGKEAAFHAFQDRYHEWGAWIVFGAGITPFPYKVITIASGVAQLNPLVFMIASVFARGIRFFLVAALLKRFGPAIRSFIEARLGPILAVSFVILVAGFVAVKYAL